MEWKDFICDSCEHSLPYGCKAFPDDESAVHCNVLETNKHDKPIKGQVGDYVYTPKKQTDD